MRQLEKSKQLIEEAGFSHIKLELEAQLDRNDGDSEECYDCDGDGRQSCHHCDGEGAYCTTETIGVSERDVWSECEYCDGDGEVDCSNCDGRGNIGDDG